MGKQVHQISQLVGEKCYYYHAVDWTKEDKIIYKKYLAKVTGHSLLVEDEPPYTIECLITIEIVGDHDLDQTTLYELADEGVSFSDLFFINIFEDNGLIL